MKKPKFEWKGQTEDYPMKNYPDYEKGKPPQYGKFHNLSTLDELERIWGKKWGEQGIGKLREVALVKPTDYETNPLFLKNPEFFMLRYSLLTHAKFDVNLLKQQHEEYASVLKENGVAIQYMKYPDTPMGAYGPMRKLFVAACLGFVIRGGVIVKRWGHASWMRGLEAHAQKFFADIGCPILLQVSGRGIFEDAWVWAAENVLLGSYGIACNDEAMRQVTPVLQAAGVEEVVLGHSTTILNSYESGGDFHLDGCLGIADLGLAIVYPAQLDFGIYSWLREHGFDFVEVPYDEQTKCVPCNGVLLEPGKIIMPAGAQKTNNALRKKGVDVIELGTSGVALGGINGIRCITCRLIREPGPTLGELKK